MGEVSKQTEAKVWVPERTEPGPALRMIRALLALIGTNCAWATWGTPGLTLKLLNRPGGMPSVKDRLVSVAVDIRRKGTQPDWSASRSAEPTSSSR